MKDNMILHPFPPVFDKNSKILILGSFPSVKSREQCFFYGHPKNRFWNVIAAVMNENVPADISEKTDFLLKNHIALWDVIASCEITGSADSSIKSVVPNDLSYIFKESVIKAVFVNGRTAKKYYKKFQYADISMEAICLPSTSPANAVWTFEKLVDEWKIIKSFL